MPRIPDYKGAVHNYISIAKGGGESLKAAFVHLT